MSVVIFIYSDQDGILNGDLSCAGGAFKLLVPEPVCYSVHNLLQEYDTDEILDRELPEVIIACGAEAAACLTHDGVDDFIRAPDITMPNWPRAKCVSVGAKVARILS